MKKGSNTISSIYKGSTVINKIYKGLVVVYEAFKELLASGIPPLTLLKCKEDNLVDYKIYGNSIQDGTPTPEAPIEIESCGERTENLLDKNNLMNGYIKSDGTVESVTWYKCTDYLEVSGDYLTYQNCASTSAANRYYAFYDENKNFISGAVQKTNEEGNTNYTISIPSGAKYFRCNVSAGQVDYAMVYLGNTLLEYEPYGYKVPVKITTKDYAAFDNIVGTNVDVKTKSFTINTTSLYRQLLTMFPELVVGKEYYIYFNTSDETKNYVYFASGLVRSGGKFTAAKSNMTFYGSADNPNTYSNFVIYEAEPITTNIYLNEPLRKVGDYADYIDFKNQKVYRNVEVLDDTGILTIEESYNGVTDDTGTNVELPNIPTHKGTTILSVDTTIQPSNAKVKYMGKS